MILKKKGSLDLSTVFFLVIDTSLSSFKVKSSKLRRNENKIPNLLGDQFKNFHLLDKLLHFARKIPCLVRCSCAVFVKRSDCIIFLNPKVL